MSLALFFITICVFATSMYYVLQRSAILRGVCAHTLGAYVSLGAAFLILPLVDFSGYADLSVSLLSLGILNGILFVVIDRLNMHTAKYISADASVLFNTAALILACSYGLLILREELGLIPIAGCLLIIASGLYIARSFHFQFVGVMLLKLLVSFLLFCSSLIEKNLTAHLEPVAIAFLGLFTCGSIFFFLAVSKNKNSYGLQFKSIQDFRLISLPFVCAIATYSWVAALASGSYTVVNCLIQTTVVVAFIFEFIMGTREHSRDRSFATLACAAGAIAIVLG